MSKVLLVGCPGGAGDARKDRRRVEMMVWRAGLEKEVARRAALRREW